MEHWRSIALVEALFPAEAETPWLGLPGDVVVAVAFVLGAAANFGIGFKQNGFMASRAQLLSTAMLSVLLVLSAFLYPARRWSRVAGIVPSPWITGAVAFVLGIAVLYTPPKWGWSAVGAVLAIDAAFLVLLTFFSRRTGWTALHTLSLAAGGALDYGIHAFTQKPLVGGTAGMRVSNAIFLAAAIWLIELGATRLMRCARLP